ncbi:MAG: DUF4153 domain-containing protein [Gemmatimonadota bacterium]|nr:DUF4153 domain-containing protein [Gemmatimonadota bacterium]
MALPSIQRVIDAAVVAFRRFPLVVASGVLTAVAGIGFAEGGDEDTWVRIGAATSLGMPLFTALTLAARRRGMTPTGTWALRAAGGALLFAWFIVWPGWSDELRAVRYFHLSAGLHFLVAVVAYVGRREENGFWQFNRELFIRFLTAAVYSTVLFAGLAIALAGVDNLLGVDVDGSAYGDLFMVIAFAFNTWFFAAGIPLDFDELERDRHYPPGLRAFSQYVLLPLVTVYLVILSAYLVRVLVTREWPSGWIGYLVSALATLGILSLLLVHPLRDRGGHAWIDRYARWFWIAILPSVAMLLMAIWQRIHQYGVTERRYLLAVLAVWLAGTAVFYAVTRSRDIRIIPASLMAIAFVTLVGPWSAYAVSLGSQLGRLTGLLERNGAFADGRVSPAVADVPEEDRREITGALTYVIRFHGTGSIDGWFPGGVAAIDTIGDGTRPSPRYIALERATLLMRHMGMEPVSDRLAAASPFRSYSTEYPRPAFDVAGFEWAFLGVSLGGETHAAGEDRIRVSIDGGSDLVLLVNDEEVLRGPLGPFLDGLEGHISSPEIRTVPGDLLRLDAEGDGYAIRIYFRTLTEDRREGSPRVSSAMGDVFLRRVP